MQRRILILGVAIALLAGLSWFLWSPQKPNFLLITLDTTRADRLGCYGYSAGDTPVLDSLAAQGVLCERAFTVAPITLPSHTAMFTGLYPAENGVVTNGRGRLDDGIPTLAEALKREGYDTGAFVASFVLNGKFGLDRGFRTYDDDFASDEASSDAQHRQRNGESVVDAALKWLRAKRGKPFFCWVHLYDPHAPYLPHPDLFGNKYLSRPYDAEIAYVDRQVGRLVDFLKTRGLESRTLVAVAGDHGEGQAEHLEQGHGLTLYDETMQVPLIFRHVGKLPARRRVAGSVSLVDLSPTILDLLGLKSAWKITGKSLKNVLAGGGDETTGLVYGATDDPFLNYGWSPLRSLIEGQWKYIRTTKPELYDLAADPQERTNLLEAEPDTARAMQSRMAEFESRLVRREAIAVQLSARDRQALEGLGYLGGSKIVPTGPAPAELPDVKDMLLLDAAVEGAVKLARAGSVNEAISQLQEIIGKAPARTDAYWYLAGILADASQPGQAEQVLRSLLAINPDSSRGHYSLAVILNQQGKTVDAIAEFQKSIEMDPESAEAHHTLARLLMTNDETENALAHFNAALEIDPQHDNAYQGRAKLLTRLGRTAEAIADYQMALKYAPNTAEAHYHLGMLLIEAGDADEGGRHLVRAVEINPQNASSHFALGVFLLRQRQYDAAIHHLARAVELKPGYAEAKEQLDAAREARAANLAAPNP
jgi:arylsulfatase A-like enzyme/Flp pilus assembly protein TadD